MHNTNVIYTVRNLTTFLVLGHTVTALARNPKSIPAGPKISVEKGTPSEKEDLERCFVQKVPDLVFVTLASSTDAPNGALLTYCVTNLVDLMKKYGTRRIVYMSAYGVDDSFQALNWMMRFLASKTKLATDFKDHKGAEQVLKESTACGIQWTVVRPVMLKNGPVKAVKILGDYGEDIDSFMPGVTRATVADFMVKAIEDDRWLGHTPVICN